MGDPQEEPPSRDTYTIPPIQTVPPVDIAFNGSPIPKYIVSEERPIAKLPPHIDRRLSVKGVQVGKPDDSNKFLVFQRPPPPVRTYRVLIYL